MRSRRSICKNKKISYVLECHLFHTRLRVIGRDHILPDSRQQHVELHLHAHPSIRPQYRHVARSLSPHLPVRSHAGPILRCLPRLLCLTRRILALKRLVRYL